MRGLIVIVIALFGLTASVRSRFAALLLYLWFAFFRPQEWAWNSIATLRLSLIIGIAFVVPSVVTGVWPDLKHRLSQLVALFLCMGLLAQIDANYAAPAWKALDQLARNIVVALLAVTLITDERRFLLALTVVAGSLGIHASRMGIGFLLRGGAKLAEVGIGGMFGDNNDVALAATRVLFMLIACWQLYQSRIIRLGLAASIPLTACCIVATFSRGGFLALLAASLVFAMVQQKKKTALAVLAGIAVAAAIAGASSTEYADRVKTIWTYDTAEFKVGATDVKVGDDSVLGRLHFWSVASDMAASSIFGVGMKNFEWSYNKFDSSRGQYGRNRSVHSSYFQVLAEMGYPGLVVWLVLLTAGLLVILRVRARSQLPQMPPEAARFYFVASNAVLVSMVAFIVGGAFLAQAYNDLNWITFAFAASLDRLSAQRLLVTVPVHKVAA